MIVCDYCKQKATEKFPCRAHRLGFGASLCPASKLWEFDLCHTCSVKFQEALEYFVKGWESTSDKIR